MNRRIFLAGAAALAYAPAAFAQTRDYGAAARYSAERRGVSLLIMHAGRILFEDYPNEGAPGAAWELASGTKSFCGIIAAAAVRDGLLTLDDRAADTLPEWRADPRKRRITIRQLLSLCSGIDAGRLLRLPTYADAVAADAAGEPGAAFAYGPNPFQIFGEIMRRKLTRDADPLAYLQRRVFDALDIRPQRWRRGADNMPHLPSGAALTAREWAAFGRFVETGGQGVLDGAALAANFAVSPANPGYGMSWWLLRPGLIPPRPGAGVVVDNEGFARLGDVRMAAGAGDQRLYLLPQRGLVIARQARLDLRVLMGRDGAPRFSDAEFLRLILG